MNFKSSSMTSSSASSLSSSALHLIFFPQLFFSACQRICFSWLCISVIDISSSNFLHLQTWMMSVDPSQSLPNILELQPREKCSITSLVFNVTLIRPDWLCSFLIVLRSISTVRPRQLPKSLKTSSIWVCRGTPFIKTQVG